MHAKSKFFIDQFLTKSFTLNLFKQESETHITSQRSEVNPKIQYIAYIRIVPAFLYLDNQWRTASLHQCLT